MTDWAVWPIFIVELIALLLIIPKRGRRIFSIRIKTISLSLLIIASLLIVISLYHDATEVLNLHF